MTRSEMRSAPSPPATFVDDAGAAACSSAARRARRPSKAAAAKTYKDMTVGFIQTGSESGWRAANTASFKETATQLGINLKFYDAQNKLENQVSAFHQFNQDPSVNVIILAALDVKGYDESSRKPRTPARSSSSKIAASTRPEHLRHLHRLRLRPRGPEGRGRDVRPAQEQRQEERRRDLRRRRRLGGHRPGQGLPREDGRLRHRHPRQTQTGNWGVPESKAVMEAFLKKSKDIQGVFAHNDEEAIGAIQAIKEAGLVPGKDIQVIGVDATADGVQVPDLR